MITAAAGLLGLSLLSLELDNDGSFGDEIALVDVDATDDTGTRSPENLLYE